MKPALAKLFPCETDSPEATRNLGRLLSASLQAGDVLALYGPLGAGKTQLIKGIAEGLGIPETEVSSPTFTLMNVYLRGRLPLYHFDAYRINHLEAFYNIGYEEYFYGAGISVIEWPERIEPLLPPETLRIRLEHQGENRRRITLLEV